MNAVECAVAIQKTMAERNATVEADRRCSSASASTSGDVIHDDARVYGDGVNIAARLEAIAEPGGICVSGTAYEHVHKKLPLTFSDLGEQQLKNIAARARLPCRTPYNGRRVARSRQKAALALPDKPSIAVLPFTNMSGDPKQDYFSDGITEDIITELSRVLRAVRHRPQFELPVQGQVPGHPAGRSRAWRALRPRRQHPPRRRSRPHHSAAHRCRDRCSSLGRALRP